MRIKHLRINNVLGIEELDTDVAPNGMLISGANGRGKTSTLKAIQMGLTAQGVDEHAIRIGAERGEIYVDMDDLSVRRVITAKGSTLTVTNGDGFKASKPAQHLADLLGSGAAIDPLALFAAKPADRRKMILSALPVTVSLEQLRQWVPNIPANYDCSGHGLEVIERVRKQAYDQRTQRNADAKKAREEADRAAVESTKLVAPEGAATVADARATLDRAKAHATELDARRASVTAAIQRTEGARAKAAQLRADADAVEVPKIDVARSDALFAARQTVGKAISDLESRLLVAKQELSRIESEEREIAKVYEQAERGGIRQSELRAQAATIEETIGAATPTGPSEADIESALKAIDVATLALVDAEAAERAAVAAQRAADTATTAKSAEAEAARLDAIVKVLTNDAPASLLAASNGIPGLSLEGDDILFDGKSLGNLCGAEGLRFAVQIAKRSGGKTRFLLVDGIERLDPEQYDAFIAEATSGGWQCLCTKVGRGEVTYEAISAEESTSEAAE